MRHSVAICAFIPKMPAATLLAPSHLSVAAAIGVLGQGQRLDDRGIHNGAGLEQQPRLFQQGADFGQDALRETVPLEQMPEAQDRRFVGYRLLGPRSDRLKQFCMKLMRNIRATGISCVSLPAFG